MNDRGPPAGASAIARIPFAVRIVAAIALGGLVGWCFGTHVSRLGDLGAVILDVIKALAGPLLFLAVVDAFLRTRVEARNAALMVAISLTNAVVAIGIGLTLSNVLRPGDYLVAPPTATGSVVTQARKLDFFHEVASYVPRNLFQPFLDNSVITIVITAVFTGWALRSVKNEQERSGDQGMAHLESLVMTAFRTTEVMLAAVITLVPLAVFGVVARTVGRDGLAPLRGLSWYVGVAMLGLAIQVFVVYQAWIVFVARMPLRRFWAGSRDALVYAVGSSSSLATLPVTLRCLDRMRISPQSARLAACVGTNLNNDGILLYEAMAVLFVAQVHGIQLSLGQQAVAAASCALAGIGIAAVPDAGLISLALVLTTVGLPMEVLPLLLTVDWLLSRCRAVTNVTSDILVAVLLDRFAVVENGQDEKRARGVVSDPGSGGE